MPASSQASSELSTASLTVVRSALAGLSKPRRCRFLVKNSLTEMSRWRVAMVSAVARRAGRVGSLRPSDGGFSKGGDGSEGTGAGAFAPAARGGGGALRCGGELPREGGEPFGLAGFFLGIQ